MPVNGIKLARLKRHIRPLEDRTGLALLETRTFGSGVVYLRYEAVSSNG